MNDDLVNNKSLMEIFKKICYSWKTFNDLKMSYKYALKENVLKVIFFERKTGDSF